MTTPRLIGLALLIAGVVLLVIGLNASHSLADQVSNTFTGRFTQATTWYIIGGIVMGIVGAVLVFTGFGSNAAK
jgi:amino acid transporter